MHELQCQERSQWYVADTISLDRLDRNQKEITAPMIRKWQGEMMEKGFKPTYLKSIISDS